MNIFDRVERQGFMLMEAFEAFRDLVAEAKSTSYRAGGFDAGSYEDDSYSFDERYPHAPGYENDKYPCEDAFESAYAMEDSYNENDLYPDVPEPLLDEQFAINSGWEAFPGRKAFSLRDINAEDPEFWGGKEIGIPINLAIRVSPEQGLQLPEARGPLTRGF